MNTMLNGVVPNVIMPNVVAPFLELLCYPKSRKYGQLFFLPKVTEMAATTNRTKVVEFKADTKMPPIFGANLSRNRGLPDPGHDVDPSAGTGFYKMALKIVLPFSMGQTETDESAEQ
jgi:hypothetical protein